MERRCDSCGMVREVEDGDPCADVGCSGVFRRNSERPGLGGAWGPPAKVSFLLSAVVGLYQLVMTLFGP